MKNFNDLLTEMELCQVAGIEYKAKKKPERIAKVLMKAGIFYWFKEDGSVGTTWHHIHNPKPTTDQISRESEGFTPNFGAMQQ